MTKIELELINVYQKMSDLTNPECAKCPSSNITTLNNRCCAPKYCELAIVHAKENWEITLKPTEDFKNGLTNLPMMNIKVGCSVAPYLRPTCTLHYCQINTLGVKLGDPEWTKKYYKLKELIEFYEMSRFLEKDNPKELEKEYYFAWKKELTNNNG